MTLFKATAEGNVPMTEEEEAAIKAFWDEQQSKPIPKPKKSLEERVAILEQRLDELEQPK